MLTESLKETIRNAYSALVEAKALVSRPGQRQMIAEIAKTLARTDDLAEGPAVCVIEAGTGTGKTIAYAVSAIPIAKAREKRLVVATATVSLQEQFVGKDLPEICEYSGLKFNYALAKGRRRYVCLSKLDCLLQGDMQRSGLLPLDTDDMSTEQSSHAIPVYQMMLDALGRGDWDGDLDGWPDAISDAIWSAVTTDHNQCAGRRCPNIGTCSFFRARDRLQSADVIVANHDLVLADLALGGGTILPAPEDCIYVFDEGHHLPDKALAHFASFCRLHATAAWLQDSEKALGNAMPLLAKIGVSGETVGRIRATMVEIVSALRVVEQMVAGMFDAVEIDAAPDEHILRFPHGVVPEALRAEAQTLDGLFSRLGSDLERIAASLQQALEDDFSALDKQDVEIWHINIGAMSGRVEGSLALWRDFAEGSANARLPHARWVRLWKSGDQFGYDLRSSPVLAVDILEKCLWSRAAGVVVTSATLTALGSFDRFRLHAGAPERANFQVVASPFTYENAVFAVPAMPCDPGDASGHTGALIKQLPGIIDRDEGTLVLFSSRRQLTEVFDALSAQFNGQILRQGDYGKQELLRKHRQRIDSGVGSVIFGLASFAEGIDLPGDYCRHVVIAKLPFAVPDSPLEAALAEWIEAQGRSAFMEISVPDAALRLVQASGRLLRTEQDVGRITLMDTRVLSRRYGRAILDSLPPFRREFG